MRAGCNGGGCHAQMYTMGTLLRHGSDKQKAQWLPKVRQRRPGGLQAFGVTEPTSGTDTSSLKTFAKREGNDSYIVNGQKIWTSRAEHSDLMILWRAHLQLIGSIFPVSSVHAAPLENAAIAARVKGSVKFPVLSTRTPVSDGQPIRRRLQSCFECRPICP